MGLWPARQGETTDADSTLNISRLFVDAFWQQGLQASLPRSASKRSICLVRPKSR